MRSARFWRSCFCWSPGALSSAGRDSHYVPDVGGGHAREVRIGEGRIVVLAARRYPAPKSVGQIDSGPVADTVHLVRRNVGSTKSPERRSERHSPAELQAIGLSWGRVTGGAIASSEYQSTALYVAGTIELSIPLRKRRMRCSRVPGYGCDDGACEKGNYRVYEETHENTGAVR